MILHNILAMLGSPSPCHVLRMQRYATAVKKGKVKANPEVIKLWGSESGRTMAKSSLCSTSRMGLWYAQLWP